MLADITMIDGTCHEVSFGDCEDITAIRTWLNSGNSFISIANHTVLNTGHIITVRESNDDDESDENTEGNVACAG